MLMLTCFVPDPCFNVLISSSMPRAWTDCTFDTMQTSNTYWTELWTSEHKKSKATFSSISWPFPSSSESFLSDSLRFALAFEYLLITTFVIAFNHYVIIKTICTQFCHHFSYFGLCGYWGFCVFADLIFLRLVAPMGRILCQLVLFEQQHPTPLLRNLSPFFENLTS